MDFIDAMKAAKQTANETGFAQVVRVAYFRKRRRYWEFLKFDVEKHGDVYIIVWPE